MSNLFEIDDEIVEIEYLGEQDTIDINTTGNRLFYANGILTHNSAVEEIEFDHSHISGGLSKIQTADNVIGIFTSRAMKERGKYQIQFMKTRSSSGVGHKVDLDFNIETLKITDPDEDEYSSNPQPSFSQLKNQNNQTGTKTNSVFESLKRSSSVVEKIDEETGEIIELPSRDPNSGSTVSKIVEPTAKVKGVKTTSDIRSLLASLNTDVDDESN